MCDQLITIWGHLRTRGKHKLDEWNGMWENDRKAPPNDSNTATCIEYAPILLHELCMLKAALVAFIPQSAGLMNHAYIFFALLSLQICSHFSCVFEFLKCQNKNVWSWFYEKYRSIFHSSQFGGQSIRTIDLYIDEMITSLATLITPTTDCKMCDKSINGNFSDSVVTVVVMIMYRSDAIFSPRFTWICRHWCIR